MSGLPCSSGWMPSRNDVAFLCACGANALVSESANSMRVMQCSTQTKPSWINSQITLYFVSMCLILDQEVKSWTHLMALQLSSLSRVGVAEDSQEVFVL